MATNHVKAFQSLEIFPNPTSGSRSKGQSETLKVYSTKRHVFVTTAEATLVKSLPDSDNELLNLPSDPIRVLQKHPSPITCLGISEKGWLVCTCSDTEVMLSKLDSMLNTFDSNKIGVDIGRIHSCAVSIRDNLVFVSLAKPNELMIIQCTGSTNIVDLGPLDLTKIEIMARSEKITEASTWLQNIRFNEFLNIVGISSGNSVSLKMWEVKTESEGYTVRLRDHRMTFQSKAYCSADLRPHEGDSYLLVVMSPEGLCEVLIVKDTGFGLLTRVKIEESIFGPTVVEKDLGSNMTIKIDFKVLAARHFVFGRRDSRNSSALEASISHEELPDLDNTLSLGTIPWEYPKILLALASTRGISIFNARSGESELSMSYKQILNGTNPIASAGLCTDTESNQLHCVLQPFLSRSIYTFRLTGLQRAQTESTFSLTSANPIPGKSVLRKRLKSPPRAPPKKPTPSKGPLHPQRFRVPGIESGGPAWSKSPSKLSKAKKPMPSALSSLDTARGSGEAGPVASVRIQPKSAYSEPDLIFGPGVWLPTRLSESLTHLRMAFSWDGKVLAAGGNDSPLVIYKTLPVFECLKVYRDPRRITAMDFPITSNSTHLLLASADGKTEIINWKTGAEILSLKFPSKFSEHLHSQFFYMDNFILQPEDNRLVLYAYRGAIQLKAGSFLLPFQKITALAAPNQFYSSSILCAGSNKSIQLFDAGEEKISLNIQNCHSKPIATIRINEAPKGAHATSLCDIFLTSTNSATDPIKLWDLRTAKCITRIADLNERVFVPTSRPALSPCGRYIASGYEENSIVLYDLRKTNSRVATMRQTGSSVIDLTFDKSFPMLWCGCRNGNLWNFSPK